MLAPEASRMRTGLTHPLTFTLMARFKMGT